MSQKATKQTKQPATTKKAKLAHFDNYDPEDVYDLELLPDQEYLGPDIKCAYKTQYTKAGKVMEVKVYTSFPNRAIYRRAKKMAKTRRAQQLSNLRRAQQEFVLRVNANFGDYDYFLTHTYDNDHLPADLDQVKRDIVNYIARLNYWRKAHGLPKLEYIYVIENAENIGSQFSNDRHTRHDDKRVHFHMFMRGDMDERQVLKTWGKGIQSEIKYLKDSNEGLVGISIYTAKGPKFSQLWRASKGLKKPVTKESYSLFRKSELTKLARDQGSMKAVLERKFPGYRYSEEYPGEIKVNPVIGGYYLYVRLYKQDDAPKTKRPKEAAVSQHA